MEEPLPEIQRPTRPGSWHVGARSKKVAADWAELCHQVSGEGQRVYDQLQSDPQHDDGDRQHPLYGTQGRGTFQGREFQRWQIDITSGGRIWYFIDPTPFGAGQRRRAGTVIIDAVHAGHPKQTETRPTHKRRPGRR